MRDWVWLAFLLRAFGDDNATRLVVNWWTPNDIDAISRQISECGKESPAPDPFTATFMVCPESDPFGATGPGARSKCTATETRAIAVADRAGSLVFENVPRGRHVVQFTAGTLPPVIRPIRVYGGKVTEEQVEVRWTMIYGKVTKDGKPFHGRVFEAAVTDPETGRYNAALAHLPGPTLSVHPCDGSQAYWFVADPEPVENAAFDIEIPSNRIDVDVVDAASGQPVKAARVSYAAVKDGKTGSAHFAMSGGRSDERGRVSISPVVAKRKLKICGRHEDYENSCGDAIEVGVNEKKQVRLALSKIEKREGRIFTPGKSEVWWYALDGLSERITTDEEGSFTYKRPHAQGEIVAVSSQAGFFVLTQPPLEPGQTFEIRLPGSRRRTFEVHLDAKSTDEMGFFTIALDELVVPHQPFADHIFRSPNQQAALKPGWTTLVTNVFETAPISVIYAPKSFIESRMPNWWMRPEARTLPRRALGDQTRVPFD